MQTRRNIDETLRHWQKDATCTYMSWFLWPDRLKHFRSIRTGLLRVIDEIRHDKLGRQYRGTSLEKVVQSIADQKQLFKGADHAFMWKPKLRIPDIYENRDNQIAFGTLINRVLEATSEKEVISAILELDQKQIKGLKPAVANLLYFLHPTVIPPTNTSIIKGYNVLTGGRVRLGQWDEYLAMRAGILRLNEENRGLLSNDLGAIAAFLFDVGRGRCAIDGTHPSTSRPIWEADLAQVRRQTEEAARLNSQQCEDVSHTEVQGWLRDLGISMGLSVWIAVNDRTRSFGAGILADGCLCDLPPTLQNLAQTDTISRIDVIWFDKTSNEIVAAFEIEHSTAIYSGILRLYDLALSSLENIAGRGGLYVVAPDNREAEVQDQLRRPAFCGPSRVSINYIAYSDLAQHRQSIARFGEGLRAIDAIARKPK